MGVGGGVSTALETHICQKQARCFQNHSLWRFLSNPLLEGFSELRRDVLLWEVWFWFWGPNPLHSLPWGPGRGGPKPRPRPDATRPPCLASWVPTQRDAGHTRGMAHRGPGRWAPGPAAAAGTQMPPPSGHLFPQKLNTARVKGGAAFPADPKSGPCSEVNTHLRLEVKPCTEDGTKFTTPR